MLQNAYLVAKIGADTAENEQHFAEILPIGRRVADHGQIRGSTRTGHVKDWIDSIWSTEHLPARWHGHKGPGTTPDPEYQ